MNPYSEETLLGGMLESERGFIGLRDELELLLARVSEGRPAAVSLVGPRGLGKSFMLRYLADPRRTQHALAAALGPRFRDEPDRLVFVLLDFSSYAASGPVPIIDALYEQLLDRLGPLLGVEDARLLPLDRLPSARAASLAALRDLAGRALSGARRAATDEELREGFARSLGSLQPGALLALLARMDAWGLRAVFLVDEFDSVAPRLDRTAFDHLRSLLILASLVIASARALSEQVPAEARTSPFFNLLQKLNLLSLHFLSRAEARRLVAEPPTWFAWSNDFRLSEADVDWILEMTGLHPDLIRVSCENLYMWVRRRPVSGDLLQPAEGPYLRARLGTLFTDFFAVLWHELGADERRALIAVAADNTSGATPPPTLINQGYVVFEQGRYRPFAGLFRDYVLAQRGTAKPASPPLPAAPGRPPLTDLEERLLGLLEAQPGTIVGRDAIVAALYEGAVEPQEARGRLDALVFRLRAKLEGEALRIESVRGQGYRLMHTYEP